MYLSTKHTFELELLRLVNEELSRLEEMVASGHVQSYEDYKHHVGRISGLRSVRDYVDEANANIEKGL